MTSLLRSKKAMAFALTIVALAVFGAQRLWTWRDEIDAGNERDAAVAAASSEVTKLISVSAQDSDAAFRELLAGATASFRADLEKQAEQLQKALAANKVVAKGTVVSAGVGRSTDTQATVFVAATGTVTNAGTAAPQNRDYRVKVEMRKVGERWLVAGLEFVA
jgi:Mce-associated membrane protein